MHFVDVHTHILPEVDDGAASIDETIAMLRIAYDGGTRKIAATPHMFLDLFGNDDVVQVQNSFQLLMLDLHSRVDLFPFLEEMKFYLGAENYVSPEFLEALEQGCVLSLNGSRYLLVEFSPSFPFSQIEEAVQRVFGAGYTPVLAHPERYAAIQEDPLRMEAFWEMGGVVQVNAGSLLRGEGSDTRKCAQQLLEEGLVDVIASDGHRPQWRPPNLQRVFELLEDDYETEDIAGWLWENAEAILVNESLEVSREDTD